MLTDQQLAETPGVNLDDRLRQVPGFSLFRRSSSLVANPTTQGVSLRGTGSSGASRTLILWDSIPINDPFGGWVYWTRIDPNFISEVDIDRGASTSIFGDRAMGGAISLFSPPEQHQHIFANYFGGNEDTQDISAAYSNVWGPWGLSLHSRDFTTDGYYITPEPVRGAVDTKANVRFATGDLNLDYSGAADRLSLHVDILAEERHNGTVLTHNSTGLGTIGGNYTHSWSNDQVSLLGFHTQEQYHSTFSSVSLNRNSETLTSRQTVPVQDIGGAAYWRHHGETRHFKWNSLSGADVDDVHGISYDYSYNTHILTPSGGTLLEHGLFAQGDLSLGPVSFFAGIRHQFTGERGETFVSPNGGVALGVKRFRLRTSAYRSFRAPTLNELYRQFRVGNALTLANSDLIPEALDRRRSRFRLDLGRNANFVHALSQRSRKSDRQRDRFHFAHAHPQKTRKLPHCALAWNRARRRSSLASLDCRSGLPLRRRAPFNRTADSRSSQATRHGSAYLQCEIHHALGRHSRFRS